MSIVLLVVGLLATAAGFVTIGFGIPINAFSLGNTLIIAGTVGVAAGLILIGLASAIGQLRRIAEALNGRPLARGARSAESVEAMVPPTARMTPVPAAPPSPVPTRMPGQPKPPEMRESPFPDLRALEPDLPDQRMPEPEMPDLRGLEPELPDLHQAEPPREPAQRPLAPRPPMPRPPMRQPEPRFPVTASEPQPGPLDWLRAKSKPAAPAAAMPPGASETPMVELQDEAPLSPRPPLRHAMPAEPALEPKVWSPSRAGGPAESRSAEPRSPEPRPATRAEQPMPRATPQPEPAKDKDDFDFVWPERTPAASGSEPAKREAHVDMPLPPIPARPREPRPASPKPAAERGPTILKSGVIDGMPYTLYADGSIEAELPQGTVKFASVDALRSHLEKQS